jgi:hypothetical protein
MGTKMARTAIFSGDERRTGMFRFTRTLAVLAVIVGLAIAQQVAYAGFPYDLANDFSTAAQSNAWS